MEAELSQGLPCTVDLRPLKKLRAGLQTADQTVTVGDRAGAASAARADVPAAAADSTRHWWVIPNDQPAWLHGAADLDDSACAELPRCVVEVGPEAATLRDFPMMQPLQTFGLAEAAELDDTDGKQLLVS